LPGEFYIDSPASDLIGNDIPASTTMPFDIPRVNQLEIGRAYRLDYQQAPGVVGIGGSIEILLPMLKLGNPNYNSTNTNFAYNVYKPTSSIVLDFWQDINGNTRYPLSITKTGPSPEWNFRYVVNANSLANGPQLLTFTIPTFNNGQFWPAGVIGNPTDPGPYLFEGNWQYIRWGVNIIGIDGLYLDQSSQYNPTTPYNRKVATFPNGSRIGYKNNITLAVTTATVTYP
jgi:hypothetical protein